MSALDYAGLWNDDITFCQEKCDWTHCPRNSINIRDKTIPHSFSVEVPTDCPKRIISNDDFESKNHMSIPQLEETEWVQISPAKIYECKLCGKQVMTNDIEEYKFCHGCGRKVKCNG